MKNKKLNSILATILAILLLITILFLVLSCISWQKLKNNTIEEEPFDFWKFKLKYDVENGELQRYLDQLPYRLELAKTTFDIRLNDSNEEVKYYEFSNHNLYFLGIEEIYLNEDGKIITLKEKLDYDKDYLVKMRNNMYYEYGIYDGGSTEYSTIYNDAFSEKIKMFTCNNSTTKNKDVHIAPIDKEISHKTCIGN